MRQVGEPSVEEILESIKKVIARDNRADASDARPPRPEPEPAPRGRSAFTPAFDVLDLGEAGAQMLGDHGFDNGAGHYEADEMPEPDDAPLLHEAAAHSMRDSLAALAMLSEPGVPPQIVRSGETSLEGLVRDMLRPMLSDWLERNLPGMVERMVAAEIARIVGKKA